MQNLIVDIMTSWGYIGVFLLIFTENIFPPIPSEVILTFAGFLTTVTPLTGFGMVLSATVGSVLGAYALYGVGRLLSAERMAAFAESKLGKVLHFNIDDIEKARGSFAKSGTISVLLCRCVPIVRSVISIPAGMAKMNILLFSALTATGSLAWNIALVALGAFAGDNWHKVTEYFSAASGAVKVLLFAAVIVIAIIFWRRKRKAKV